MKRKVNKVFRRYFSITYPNGETRRAALPKVKGVKLGGVVNISFIWGGQFVIATFRRVKGGWEFPKELNGR